MFHVKHTPIEKPPPHARPAFDELMDVWLDYVRWELPCQFGDTACFGAVNSRLEPLVTELNP